MRRPAVAADEEAGDGARVDCGSCRFLTDATRARASLPKLEEAAAAAEESLRRAKALQAEAGQLKAGLPALEDAELVMVDTA